MEALLLELFRKAGLLTINPKNFLDPDGPVKKGEKVLGEMNDIEKCCWTFLENQKEKHEELHFKVNNLPGDSKEHQMAQKEHDYLHSVEESVRSLMWASIKDRFPIPKKATGRGLRKDFRIVATFEQDRESSGFPFPFGFGGFTVIEIPG